MRTIRAFALVIALGLIVGSGVARAQPPIYEAYAIRFGTLPAFPVSGLVAGAAAGVKPEDITDIIISHAHWDHVDGVDLFPKATVWIQRDEYAYYTGGAWHARSTHGGVDEEVPGHDPAVFERFAAAGPGIVQIK